MAPPPQITTANAACLQSLSPSLGKGGALTSFGASAGADVAFAHSPLSSGAAPSLVPELIHMDPKATRGPSPPHHNATTPTTADKVRVAPSEGCVRREGPRRRLGRRLEEVTQAVGGGYCRLQMPLSLALGVRGTVAGHRLGALEGGGGGYLPPPFQCRPTCPPLEERRGPGHRRGTGKMPVPCGVCLWPSAPSTGLRSVPYRRCVPHAPPRGAMREGGGGSTWGRSCGG